MLLIRAFLVALAVGLLLSARLLLGWYADRRLRIRRFHLRDRVLRAGSAFLTAPEIEQ
ncbi:MAG TPA: hypothetical protein VNB49_07895 [Candidatus Dormibacteraeota bacterium]|nr:hypothetical protein [Candidatus Dormibacteraeota bacterium]